MTVSDRVELASYKFKYISEIWFTYLKDNRSATVAPVTWKAFYWRIFLFVLPEHLHQLVLHPSGFGRIRRVGH